MFLGIHHPWSGRSFIPLLLLAIPACADIQVRPADPLVGTWILNVARSKFNPGPAPEGITVTYEQTPNGLHVVSVVTIDGTPTRSEYTAAYDGKDYPIKGVPQVDTVQVRKIDALTSERIDKRAGKRVQSYTRQVYADGLTLVVTQKGTDATGSTVDNMMLFEKK
jgi:hypothetical protein